VKAILLAAGRGSRLGAFTDTRPKSLLEFGDTTLIEHSLQNLQRAGISQAVVIVGYLHEQLEAAIRRHNDESFCRIVRNPDYTRGSGSSLRCAAEEIRGDTLVIEADLLYHEDVIRRLIRTENALALAHFNHDRVEGKITLKDGFIHSMIWGDASMASDGDWVGITKLSSESADFLRSSLRQPFDPNDPLSQQYSTYVFELLDAFRFRAVTIDDLPWIEIDNEADALRAQRDIYPRLCTASFAAERNQP
jgi:choline kinase